MDETTRELLDQIIELFEVISGSRDTWDWETVHTTRHGYRCIGEAIASVILSIHALDTDDTNALIDEIDPHFRRNARAIVESLTDDADVIRTIFGDDEQHDAGDEK